MYQFIRIGILYFQLKIVMLFIQYSLYFCTTTHIIIPFTTHTNFIHTRSQTYQCSSIILFISTYPIEYGIWSRASKVYWCMSSHFPHLFLFVHLSIIGSLLSFRYRQKSCYFIRPVYPKHIESILDHDDCVCSPFILDTMAVVGMPEYSSDMDSCNFDDVSWSA